MSWSEATKATFVFSTLMIIKWKINHIKGIRNIYSLVCDFLLWGKLLSQDFVCFVVLGGLFLFCFVLFVFC